MDQVKNFCEIVKRDRELAGLTQYQLANMLNKVESRPVDVHTKKMKIASRTWVAKLEAGLLRRELSLDVRQWLAKTLSGNISLYQTLPSNPNQNKPKEEAFTFGNLDVLPLVKHLAKSNLNKITFDKLYRLCEAYRYCSKVGVSLVDPFEVGDGTPSVKS